MKRRLRSALALAVAAILALSLVACGKSSGDDAADGQSDGQADGSSLVSEDGTPFCVGYWKYDDYPIYIGITDGLSWAAYDESGNSSYHGQIKEYEDGYLMYYDGSSEPEHITVSDGKLVDQDGSTLSRVDSLNFTASMTDKLTQVAYFPGKFESFSINYPDRMQAAPRTDLANSLNFTTKSVQKDSPDYYSNIMVTFQPLVDVDKYLCKGAGLAQPCMGYLINNCMNTFYGPYIIKTIGTDFVDMGSYYKMTGYMWLDGSIFPEAAQSQILGIVQMRYFGPTGYALIAVTIAPIDVVENYYGICLNMLDTCTYKTDWSTAPKVVPKQPGSNRGKTKQKQTTKKKVTGSDRGDYLDTFYWTDEDGDIWYWNGYENIFQSYGDDGYIDDDGEFYESNDAGWDTDDDYYIDDYDPWSDPGDYADWSDPGDYADWSDPGDYADDDYNYDYDDYDDGGYDDYDDGGYDDWGDDDW